MLRDKLLKKILRLWWTMPATQDDELGQRWCLGCRLWTCDCQCHYIPRWEWLRQWFNRPEIDTDPIYGPCPLFLVEDTVFCTQCVRPAASCGCYLEEAA